MKAIVIWNSYFSDIKLCDVEKETDEKVLRGYREPEGLYKITKEYLSCKASELEFNINDIKYIGYTKLMESYVYPVTDEYFQEVLQSRGKLIKKEQDEFNNLLNEYKKAPSVKRNEILDKILSKIKRTDNFILRHERHNIVDKMLEDIRNDELKKAIETGENQLIGSRMVRCSKTDDKCNFDLIEEYLTPENKIETVRVHTY